MCDLIPPHNYRRPVRRILLVGADRVVTALVSNLVAKVFKRRHRISKGNFLMKNSVWMKFFEVFIARSPFFDVSL